MSSLGPEKGDALFFWMAVQMPEWGREGWRRAGELSSWALQTEATSR